MKIAVTSMGTYLGSQFSPVFGRCPAYVFVDTDTMVSEGITNDAANAAGGAGIQAAQFVVSKGVAAVITGNVGPNAYNVLAAANVPVYLFNGSTVGEAIEAFKAGTLRSVSDATGPAHGGLAMTRGAGGGRGMGGGRRMGMGMGMGAGSFQTPAAGPMPASPRPAQQPQEPSPENKPSSDDSSLSSLKAEFQELQQKLERLAGEINKLEKES